MPLRDYETQWLADLGAVFYSLKTKTYSNRDRRITEMEFNRRMEIELEMQADRVDEERRRQADEERLALVAGAMGKKAAAAATGGTVTMTTTTQVKRMGTNGVVRKPNVVAGRMGRRRGLAGF